MDKNYFKNRYSVRAYNQTKEVPAELIDTLLATATHAPNTGNMQTYSVVVTRDPARIADLAPAHFNQPAIRGAKAVLTFCLDFNRFNTWCRINHTEPGLDNLQGFTWAVIDTSILAQQFCTLAELEGLGTCYLGTTTYNAEQIAKSLRLPKGVVPVVTVTVGYPAENPGVQPRLPLHAIVHHDTYNNPDDEGIRDIYAEEEALESNRRFVEENNKDSLAAVFAEVRYPKAANEQFSRVYKEFLKNQGIEI
ncbi:MAG: nitroreductase family protein [Duncaniella sp.]|nr:nitroreductase family protein [Duncaniella sp.]